MGTPYIALYPSDYLADTAHLGLTEHGIYWRMLLHYYQHGKPFPNDLERICRVILASTPEEKRVAEYVLGEFFALTDDSDGAQTWHHARADREIAAAEMRIIEGEMFKSMGSVGGRRSAEVRRAKYGSAQPKTGDSKSDFTEPPLRTPFGKNVEPPSEAKPEGVPKQPDPDKTKPPISPKGDAFDRFWMTWPRSARKNAREKCHDIWRRHQLDEKADSIMAHLIAMKQTDQWRTGFEPSPMTYLNQRRYLDDMPEPAMAIRRSSID